MFTIEIIYPRNESRTSRSLGILNVDSAEEAENKRKEIVDEIAKTWNTENIVTWIEGID